MIIFMGVAGSGKSVQGGLLADKLGYKWLSTGELLRSKISGHRRQEMLEGKLLDDEEIIGMMSEALDKNDPKKCIIDGFPRTSEQANWLIDQHRLGEKVVDSVVHIKASKELVRDRLLKRGRPDDNAKAIDQRFEEYEKSTLPIVNRFKEEGISVYEVNGEQDIDEVHAEILQKVKS